jgi:hypothetical protein
LRAQFGTAPTRQARRFEGDSADGGLSWSDPSTRVSLIQRGADTCIIFEARATLEQLAVLRKDAISRERRSNTALDAVLLSDTQREAWKRDDPRGAGPPQPRASMKNRLQ